MADRGKSEDRRDTRRKMPERALEERRALFWVPRWLRVLIFLCNRLKRDRGREMGKERRESTRHLNPLGVRLFTHIRV